MKRFRLRFSFFVAVLLGFAVFTTPAHAQQNAASSNDRLEQLERRVNEIAQGQERQAQLMGGNQQQPSAAAQMDGRHEMPPGNMPPPHMVHRRICRLIGICIICAIIFNILIAIWIFSDIRRRGTGSGIFIVLALIAGIPTAIIYALVRIGDNKLVEPVRTP
jgi:hypothetical protein